MSSLTAVADPVAGTVTLSGHASSSFAGITRSDHNGTRAVRMRAVQRTNKAGDFELVDHEPALVGRIQYQLVENVLTDAPPAWVELAAELPRFILPSLPAVAVVVENVHGYAADRRSRSTFHEIINRNDEIVAEGRLSPRTGRLEVYCSEYIEGRGLEQLLERGRTAMYRQAEHPGLDMYFHVDTMSLNPDEDAWRLTIQYREVDHPLGDIVSAAGWTFDELARSYATFDEVAASYRSFHDLAIGEAGTL